MKKCLLAISLILGTVIGSGFSTGKEVAVFFSRFGYYSFVFIPVCFVLFYFAFYLLMTKGRKRLGKGVGSKPILALMVVCCVVFSSSMYAGISSCCEGIAWWITLVLFGCVFVLSFLACFKKLAFLSKINAILMPVLLIIVLLFFIFVFPNSSLSELPEQRWGVNLFGGGFFCVLYFVLNISLSSVVIADGGEGLTKKQIKLVSLLSAFILSAFMFLINLLIICNYEVVTSQMPLLVLSHGVFFFLLRFVILVGCLTTLLSDIYIASTSCKKLGFSDLRILLVCVALPFALSKIGFSSIVSWLYPSVSFLGAILLVLIFFRKPT